MNKKLPISTFIGVIAAMGYTTTSAIARSLDKPVPINISVNVRVNNSALDNSQSAKISQSSIKSNGQSSKSPDNSDNLTKTLIVLGLVSAVGVVGVCLSRYSRSPKPSLELAPDGIQYKALIDRVSPRLRKRLLRLINDPKTANRLLMGIQKNHGDRTPNWLAEKAIYDLRRGR